MKEQLAQLGFVGIREPNAVMWWPPALGWWLILLILIAVIVVIWRYLKSASTATPESIIDYRKLAMEELAHIEKDYQAHQNSNQLAQKLAQLLRRVVINEKGIEADLAGMTGDNWLRYLDQHFALENTFHSDIGLALTQAAYNPKINFDDSALFDTIKRALTQSLAENTETEQDHA